MLKKETTIQEGAVESPMSESILSNMFELQQQKSGEHGTLAENHLEATGYTNTLLENSVEAQAQILEKTDKTNELLEKIASKEPPKPEEIGDEKMFIVKGVKGDKGDQGERGEKGDAGEKGEQGIQGTQGIQGRQGIQGERGYRGDKGEKGEQGNDGPRGPQGQKGDQGERGKDVTVEELLSKIKGKFSYNDLRDIDDIFNHLRKLSSKTYSLSELDDVDLSGVTQNAEGKYVLGSSTGGSANFVDEEQVSGSGTAWSLANAPIVGSVHLYANGQRLTVASGDYTITGQTITTALSWDAGTLFADYRTP